MKSSTTYKVSKIYILIQIIQIIFNHRYGLSSSQSTGNIYGGGYTTSPSSIISSSHIQSTSSWNQYIPPYIGNGANPTNYDPNISYAPYYHNLFAQQYYQ
ncbi:unnamed protein product [Rotaria sp. Silwood2]|nr:unnamed protein product [Rotaria sp. Silwood2]CAF2538787.1 unnamed protein product [Rotaria sp. Silwood2]CAF2935629.1 unnamed protein product [Rotaria sp. Silwood2]CAF4298092.1 unnamed protein product [Rotaria sp. Silwood2]CAF4314231.1 unnamed protein product [Rotaria sp. Silwood2]